MDINKKIVEIQKKPEHIRLRYVWGGVAVAMFFVLIIWLFSLKETFKSTKEKTESFVNIGKQIGDQKKNMPSLEDLVQKENNSGEGEGVSQENNIISDDSEENESQGEESELPREQYGDALTDDEINEDQQSIDDEADQYIDDEAALFDD